MHAVKVDFSVDSASTATRYGKLRCLREWHIPTSNSAGEYAVWTEHYRGDSVSTLVLATSLNRILAVDMRTMTPIFEFHSPAQHGALTCFCISRRHDWLLAGTSHGVLDLWDLRFKMKLRSWTFPSAASITRLQLHPSRKTARRNRVCVSGGTNRGEVTVWDIEKVICHEIYRPSVSDSRDRLHLRDYELRNLDDDKHESQLSRVADAVRTDSSISDSTAAAPAISSSLYFGQQQPSSDSETQHAFAVTGGPDGKVRFWDCERLDGCRLINPALPSDDLAATASDPLIRGAFRERFAKFLATSTGSSTRIRRAVLMDTPLSIDRGEVTDKGSINQRAVLEHRAVLIDALYAPSLDPQIISLS